MWQKVNMFDLTSLLLLCKCISKQHKYVNCVSDMRITNMTPHGVLMC